MESEHVARLTEKGTFIEWDAVIPVCDYATFKFRVFSDNYKYGSWLYIDGVPYRKIWTKNVPGWKTMYLDVDMSILEVNEGGCTKNMYRIRLQLTVKRVRICTLIRLRPLTDSN